MTPSKVSSVSRPAAGAATTRAPQIVFAPGTVWASPRQICPPGAGLSSTIATRLPDSAARRAAARPAGPAPTTTTSKLAAGSLIGADLHARPAGQLTTSYVRATIDRHAAFEADAHAAQRTAGLAAHR